MVIDGKKVRMVDLEHAGDIVALRKEKKLSQSQVAKYCGVSLQAYQRWEHSITKEIPEERFNKLKHVLAYGIEA